MNQLQIFKNDLFEVGAKVEGETVLFDAEHVAKCLGFTETKSNKEYVRWRTVNGYLSKYLSHDVAKGSLIPEPMVYKLAFKASNETAEAFQDWLAIEVIPSIRKTGRYDAVIDNNVVSFEKQLIGVKYTSEILRVDDVSKIRMLEEAHKQHGVPTNHLPQYVQEELKKPISDLLKKHDVKISAIKANNRLLELGLLEIKQRPSTNGKMKTFKSLTAVGRKYGDNAINPNNPKETQPLYYPSKFEELIQLLLGEVRGVS